MLSQPDVMKALGTDGAKDAPSADDAGAGGGGSSASDAAQQEQLLLAMEGIGTQGVSQMFGSMSGAPDTAADPAES
jgi:hypothetical protein